MNQKTQTHPDNEHCVVDMLIAVFSVAIIIFGFFMSYAVMVRFWLNARYEQALKTWQHLTIETGANPDMVAKLSVADFKKQESAICNLNELADHCLEIAIEKQGIMVTHSTDIALCILAITLVYTFYARRDVLRFFQYFRLNLDVTSK
ncbi:hypothetical protein [Vibrio rotiferianus]|uniref:hypothetical protein n=1 Tax=Vibrio rotiferianus TaxID=190895 RepID=UPI0005F07C43|nr:hypothetical protein [Vibrio rotiferianus]